MPINWVDQSITRPMTTIAQHTLHPPADTGDNCSPSIKGEQAKQATSLSGAVHNTKTKIKFI